MGWGYCGKNETTGDEMGYSVEGVCYETGCDIVIDHGLGHVCGGMHKGGEHGCGRYFCSKHLFLPQDEKIEGFLCEKCSELAEQEETTAGEGS